MDRIQVQSNGLRVTPYQLCECCKQFCENATCLSVPFGLLKLRSPYPTILPQTVQHYPSYADLIKGLRDRCHFCTIVSEKIPETSCVALQGSILGLLSLLDWDAEEKYSSSISLNYYDSHGDRPDPLRSGINYRPLALSPLLPPVDDGERHPLSHALASTSRWTGSNFSVETLLLVQSWLFECLSSHRQCSQITSPISIQHPVKHRPKSTVVQENAEGLEIPNIPTTSMPTRLLDLALGPREDSLALVISKDIGLVPYAALSYSWGRSSPYMLTKDNYEACLLGIKEQELPKTFRDGILVARKLGLRYLWIDALCIRQTDEDDLKYELRRMGSIFEHARLVIAASDTENCGDGFIASHNPLFTNPCRLDEVAGVPYFLSTVCSGNFTYRQQHLETRGWVFQERFLAPRTVHFSHKHVQWECRERWMCEAEHIDRPCHRGRYQIKREFLRLLSLPVTPSENRDNAFSIVWRGLLEEYSATKLTKEGDFLPAISGLIRTLEDRTNMRQSFGIWLDLLPQELLWRRNVHVPIGRRVVNRAPSWSWASLHGQILDNAFTRAIESARALVAEVIRLPKSTAAEDPRYAAESPYPYILTLKCPVRKGQLMLPPEAFHDRWRGPPKEVRLFPLEGAESQEPTMMIFPDYNFEDLSDGCPITVALIATKAIQAYPHTPLCLVLTADSKSHVYHRRIAYADLSRSGWSGWSEDGEFKEEFKAFEAIDFLALDYFPPGTPVEEICIV